MRIFIYAGLVILVLSSCKKPTKLFTDIRFVQFLGEWKNIDGDTPTYINFEENGLISINRAGQLTFNNQVKSVNEGTWLGFGVVWNEYEFNQVDVAYSATKDTIAVNVGDISYEDAEGWERIRFVRL